MRIADIRTRASALYGEAAATAKNYRGYDAAADVESGRLVQELEALASSPVITVAQRIEIAVLQAQIYGCWQKPHGVRANQERAVACYEAALLLATDARGARRRAFPLCHVRDRGAERCRWRKGESHRKIEPGGRCCAGRERTSCKMFGRTGTSQQEAVVTVRLSLIAKSAGADPHGRSSHSD